jgi:hypothetical protein
MLAVDGGNRPGGDITLRFFATAGPAGARCESGAKAVPTVRDRNQKINRLIGLAPKPEIGGWNDERGIGENQGYRLQEDT